MADAIDQIMEDGALAPEISLRSDLINVMRSDAAGVPSKVMFDTDEVVMDGDSAQAQCGPTPWSAWSPCQHHSAMGVCTYSAEPASFSESLNGTRFRYRSWVGPGCEGGNISNMNISSEAVADFATEGGRELEDAECAVLCSIDCVLSAWTAHAECNQPCGGGGRVHTRTVLQPALGGGMQCGSLRRSDFGCNPERCPVNCITSEWALEQECTASCGLSGGVERSVRGIIEHPRQAPPHPHNGPPHSVNTTEAYIRLSSHVALECARLVTLNKRCNP